MRIAVAADHRGFEAKRKLLPLLKQMGHEADDFGCADFSFVGAGEFSFSFRGVRKSDVFAD